MTERHLPLGRVSLLLLCLLGALSCVSWYESRYPLTAAAERVRIVPNGQDLSVALADRCRRVGRIESVMSEHFAKLRAAEHGANLAQVLTVATSNGKPHRLDVRFWSCPNGIPLELTRR